LLLLLGAVPGAHPLFIIWLAWLAAAVVVHVWLRPALERRAVLKDEGHSAEDVAFARVLEMSLARVGRVYPLPRGVRVVVKSKGVAPATLGRLIAMPAGLRGKLSEGEMMWVVAREVGHIVSGHVVLFNLLRSVNLSSKLLGVVALPLGVLVMLLRRWSYYAQVTADRFATLACGEGKSAAQAILRLSLHAEPDNPQVTSEEVADHLAAAEGLKAQQDQIATHFRLGEYLKERPDLYARLKQIASYVGSPDYKAALEKIRPSQPADQPSR
jgi:Zn-dependent protease with chaperone function